MRYGPRSRSTGRNSMVDIGWVRRMDAITGGAIVLTPDAVGFLMTALVRFRFLLFFSADDEVIGGLGMFAAVCTVAGMLGVAAAATVFLIGARSTPRTLRAGALTALVTAVTAGLLVASAAASSPVLAMISALF